MRFRPRTWLLLSLLLFAAAFWVWTCAEKISASRLAHAARPAAQSPSALLPGPARVAGTRNAARSYRVSNTGLSERELLRSDHAILLRNALIDTDRPLKLNIPAHLRAKGAPGSYIAQGQGPLDRRFYERLKRDGVKFVSYIPNNAALVEATPEQARQMAQDAAFQAVLPYEPYYKLAASLLPAAVEQEQPLSEALNVTALAGGRDALLAAFKGMGARVMGEENGPFGTTFSVMAPPGKLAAIAQLPQAQEIEPCAPRRVLNDLTRAALGIAADTLRATSNYLNLTGSNVTVNMNDTGVDTNHPDFQNASSNGLRVTGAPDVPYDYNGHGTHVAGIIMGNGSKSGSVSNAVPGSIIPGAGFQGKATNAMLFVQSLGLVTGTTINDAFRAAGALVSDASLQTNASAQLGPTNLISNNSWGYEDATAYDMHAASFDQATRDAQPSLTNEQPMLFVFAAGGEGNGDVYGESGSEGSIVSPATAKNVITVGAIDSPRFITSRVTFDNQTTNDIFFTWTDNDDLVSWFSSCGNVGAGTEGTYGRFKPDVVAPGMFTISCRATNYVDPTNATYITTYPYSSQVLLPGQTNDYPLSIPSDTEELVIAVTANANSPAPFPTMDILGDTAANPPAVLLGATNFLALSNTLTTGEWYFGIAAPAGQIQPVSYDLTFYLIETNDLGVAATTNATSGYYSVISNLNNALRPWYVYQYGTSMSAGAVSGMLALMQEFLQTKMGMSRPSPALLKALLINGSRSAEQQYDFNTQALGANEQGWGLPNLPNSLPSSLTNGNPSLRMIDQSPANALATGQSQTYTINTTNGNASNYPVRVTLVWTDPPGDPAAGIALVNNLDLVVTDDTTTNIWLGNDFFSGDIFTEASTGDLPDAINNVQNVYIDSTYAPIVFPLHVTVLGMRVNVNAATTASNLIAQDYALVISSDDTAAPLTITTNAPTYAPPASLTALSTGTNDAGAPLLSGPLLAFALSNYNLVTVASNGAPLLHQRVGANEPNLYANGALYAGIPTDTNGNLFQWHFFVFTNAPTAKTTNYGSNVAFTTFDPPDLATQISPRTNEADLDLYVSTNSGLTNLDPSVFAAMTSNDMSVGRGGTETVIYNNSFSNEVYYVGVKSEDQQAVDFGFYAVAQMAPFSTMQNGNVVAAGTGLPVDIPDSLTGPPALVFAFMIDPQNPQMVLRNATVQLGVAHGNPSDLYGTLEHNQTQVVLNNYSGPPGGFTNNYNDLNDNTITDSVNADGPGTLKNYISATGLVMWKLTESDNALLQSGQVTTFSVTGYPQPLGLGFQETIGALQWFDDYVDVPDDATNMTISVTYAGGSNNIGPVGIFITNTDNVGFNDYGVQPINPPGGYLVYGPTNNPPLTGGTWYYGIYNYNATTPVVLNVQITFGLSLVPNLVQTYTNNAMIPLPTDATTNTSQICITNGQQVVDLSVGVRLSDPNLDDLVLQLTSPQGTDIVLFENRGGLLATNLGLTLANSNYVYTVFTEDTNLADVPIKFAPPPYATPIVTPGTTNYSTGFEDTNGTFTTGKLVDGWQVETNEVSVMTDSTVAHGGNNFLALASGRLSQTFTTVPGASYELTYYARSPGIISWWPAENNANDLLGVNNGTLVNVLTYNSGEVGEAFSFDGDDQYVQIADSPSLEPTNGVTLECWFNASDTNSGNLISKPVGAGDSDSYTIWLQSGELQGLTCSSTAQAFLRYPYTFVSNVWYHGAYTFDNKTETQTLYLNGIAVTNRNAGLQMAYDSHPVLIGSEFDYGSLVLPFNGRIDESSIYNRALSPAEIYAIYHAASSGKYSTNSLYPNFQVTIDGISTNTVIITNFYATNWIACTNSFIASNDQTTIELAGNPLSVLLDDIELVQLPYTNYNNYYLPEEPLTPLIGQNPQGCWTLSIWDTRMDSNLATNGELLSWTLQLTTSSTNVPLIVLTNGVPYPNPTNNQATVPGNGGFIYFGVDVPATASYATNMLFNATGPMNLFFNQNALPTGTLPGDVTLVSITNASGGGGTNTLAVQGAPPPLIPGQRYFLGVQNPGPSTESFNLEVQFDVNATTNITALSNGVSVNTNIAASGPEFYSFTVPTNAVMATFQLLNPTSGEADLYAREGLPVPGPYSFDYESLNEGASDQYIVITTNSEPVPLPMVNTNNVEPLSPATWYLSVYNPSGANNSYTILATYATNGASGSNGAMTIINLNNYTNSTYTNYTTNGAAAPGFPTNLLYSFTPTNAKLVAVQFTVANTSTKGNVQLLVGKGVFPTPDDFYVGSFNTGTTKQYVSIVTNAALTNLSQTWYLAVPNTSAINPVNYSITATVVTNGTATAAPLVLSASLASPASGFTMSWSAVVGTTYQIQVSTNLTAWTAVTNIIAQSTTASYTDPVPVRSQTARFFRIALPPVFQGASITSPADGFTMYWSAVAGVVYQVQVSTNLTAWAAAANITAQSTTVSYTDPVPVMSQTARFFRIVAP